MFCRSFKYYLFSVLCISLFIQNISAMHSPLVRATRILRTPIFQKAISGISKPSPRCRTFTSSSHGNPKTEESKKSKSNRTERTMKVACYATIAGVSTYIGHKLLERQKIAEHCLAALQNGDYKEGDYGPSIHHKHDSIVTLSYPGIFHENSSLQIDKKILFNALIRKMHQDQKFAEDFCNAFLQFAEKNKTIPSQHLLVALLFLYRDPYKILEKLVLKNNLGGKISVQTIMDFFNQTYNGDICHKTKLYDITFQEESISERTVRMHKQFEKLAQAFGKIFENIKKPEDEFTGLDAYEAYQREIHIIETLRKVFVREAVLQGIAVDGLDS